MTTEEKALAMVNEVTFERGQRPYVSLARMGDAKVEALCRAIEQHEAFRQEVSDAVGDTLFMVETHCDGEAVALVSNRLLQFIIPEPKPDPLVEVLTEISGEGGFDNFDHYAHNLRAALDALGFEIRKKGQ